MSDWAGDSSCTAVVVCGVPVATVSQDVGDESSRKLGRKAKLKEAAEESQTAHGLTLHV